MVRPRLLLALLAAAGASGCGDHLQAEGRYALTATEVLRDDCSLLASPEALWDGSFQRDGEAVVMTYELFDLVLTGHYREVSEEFYVDGSAANIWTEVRNAACLLDSVTVQLDAVGEPPEGGTSTAFTGTVRVSYDSLDEERCRCKLSARYRAERADG